jgi:molecular chaperone DnaJ
VAVRQAFLQMYIPCPRCEGRGRFIPSPCPTCRGNGRTHKRSKVKFRIPAGVDRGQRLRIQGEGEAGVGNGGPGDLFVVFDLESDPLYERDGVDLHRKLEVPWPVLVLGGELPIRTPYGNDTLKVAAGTQSDKVVKITNAGVPRLRGSGRGDLFLHLRVAVPQKLSPEQTELVRKLLAVEVANGTAPEPAEGFLAKVFGGGDKGKRKKKR